jgi:hypothetical protein
MRVSCMQCYAVAAKFCHTAYHLDSPVFRPLLARPAHNNSRQAGDQAEGIFCAYFSVPKGPPPHRNTHVRHRFLY